MAYSPKTQLVPVLSSVINLPIYNDLFPYLE